MFAKDKIKHIIQIQNCLMNDTPNCYMFRFQRNLLQEFHTIQLNHISTVQTARWCVDLPEHTGIYFTVRAYLLKIQPCTFCSLYKQHRDLVLRLFFFNVPCQFTPILFPHSRFRFNAPWLVINIWVSLVFSCWNTIFDLRLFYKGCST